jgi:hypothetical protein
VTELGPRAVTVAPEGANAATVTPSGARAVTVTEDASREVTSTDSGARAVTTTDSGARTVIVLVEADRTLTVAVATLLGGQEQGRFLQPSHALEDGDTVAAGGRGQGGREVQVPSVRRQESGGCELEADQAATWV